MNTIITNHLHYATKTTTASTTTTTTEFIRHNRNYVVVGTILSSSMSRSCRNNNNVVVTGRHSCYSTYNNSSLRPRRQQPYSLIQQQHKPIVVHQQYQQQQSQGVRHFRLCSRQLSQESTSTSTTTNPTIDVVASQTNNNSWQDGTILIRLGYAGLLILGLDQYLQWTLLEDDVDGTKQKINNSVVNNAVLITRQNVNTVVDELEHEVQMKRQEIYNEYKDQPALYQCKVRIEYKNMGGIYGLQNIKLHDIVDVLEEKVGNDGYYHLCRIYDNNDNNDDDKDKDDDNKSDNNNTTTTTTTTETKKERKVKSIGWYPMQYLEKIELQQQQQQQPPKSIWKRIVFWK